MIENLLIGFGAALSPETLLYCLIGVTLGTTVGVLPGIGTMATVSLLLPLVWAMADPIGSMVMLAGIFYGAQFGGSTTAILLNIPGESNSVVTAIDGHQMARNGRAGAALAVCAIGSFIAGCIATLAVAVLSEPITNFALRFGPAEFASLMILGLVTSAMLANRGFFKGLLMIAVGIVLGNVGTDITTGDTWGTFGILYFEDGIPILLLIIGLFGLTEMIWYTIKRRENTKISVKGKIWPNKSEWRRSIPAIFRGSFLGSILGMLPGAGPIVGSTCSYAVEKKLSKHKNEFGKGAVEGVAGPEAANNAAAQTSFIPILTLGVPFSPVMALMIAALMMNGIVPGPTMMTSNPELFWGLIVSFWIGNVFLLILNLPLIHIWVKLIQLPWAIVATCILIACIVGAYNIGYDWFYVWALIPFTLFGLLLKYFDFEPAPLIMGFVLGPHLDEYLTRTYQVTQGSMDILYTSPISLVLLIVVLAIMIYNTIRIMR